jgi:protein-S-isoprenylcysteine O-methyltransferase Ste14
VLVRLALHLEVLPSSPVLTVRNEFQSQGIAVVFVLLATWVVSRIEKRPLDDYGIPPRQAFSRRFWEGAVWGLGALSIIPAILWGTGHFRIDSIALHGTAVARYAVGWGAVFVLLATTEAWEPTPELIFDGPYRFTRNPMYLGMTLLAIGLGAAAGTLWTLPLSLAALGAVHLLAVRPEERYLTAKFGEPYLQYKARVRRYL